MRQRPEPVGGLRAAVDVPLRQVFDAYREGRRLDQYDGWGLHDLKAKKRWRMTVGPDAFGDVAMQALGGANGERALAIPIERLGARRRRGDGVPAHGAARGSGLCRLPFVPYLLPAIFKRVAEGEGIYSALIDGCVVATVRPRRRTRITTSSGSIISAFALSACPADGTVGAAVAYTLGDLHRPNAVLDYPVEVPARSARPSTTSVIKRGARGGRGVGWKRSSSTGTGL